MKYISEKEINKIFAKNLKYYININNITQAELAKKMNVTPATISNWCNGIKSPRMDKINSLCKLFNINRSDLIEDNPKKFNINLSDNEKLLLSKYRQLNKEQQYKVIGYIDSELNNIVKESTSIYRINNKTSYVAEEEAKYNQKVKEELNKE